MMEGPWLECDVSGSADDEDSGVRGLILDDADPDSGVNGLRLSVDICRTVSVGVGSATDSSALWVGTPNPGAVNTTGGSVESELMGPGCGDTGDVTNDLYSAGGGFHELRLKLLAEGFLRTLAL